MRSILASLPENRELGDLLVGHGTNDDAAVLRVDGNRALVQTVDFFTPIVDDPELFGEIAAANSVSDIYAMGAEPVIGLAIAAFPTDKLPLEVLEAILRGGARKAAEAGFPVAGGHTIIDDVPKYGLVVTGFVEVDRLVRNSTARPGEAIYLTKPIGTGILICAYRALANSPLKRALGDGPPDIGEATRSMAMLNRDAARIMMDVGVSAATDVTGYGLLGHLSEVCAASGIGARIDVARVPLLAGTREYHDKGYYPGGSERNAKSLRGVVESTGVADADFRILCDAQTSGGLLLTVSPDRCDRLEERFRTAGLMLERIGETTGDAGRIELV